MRPPTRTRKDLNDKPVSSTLLLSSDTRGWAGLTAGVWSHSQGSLFHNHTAWDIDLAIDIASRGGATVERFASKRHDRTVAECGTVWLGPCRERETVIRISDPLPGVLHLRLPQDTFEAAGFEKDVYRSLVPLMYYDGGFQDPLIVCIGEAILAELRTETSAGKLLVESLSTSLAVRLVQQHMKEAPAILKDVVTPPDITRRCMSEVLDYIDENVEADLSVDELASIACMSRFHFSRVFKLATGLPPYRYVSTKRFERARELLDKGDRPLGNIAFALGFSSESNFSRAFRQATGLTPRQFRERGH
jgi:AraC family transcriptional regulator